MAESILTQERLKELLHYSIISGKFYWNKNRGGTARINSIAGYVSGVDRYRRIAIDGKRYLAHRLAFLYVMGRFPIDQTDHLNHNRDDNRWLNLRECTGHENHRNQKLRLDNTSGMNGIHFDKQSKRWVVQFQINGKVIWGGSYSAKEEAIQAREQVNIDHGFHPNHGVKVSLT